MVWKACLDYMASTGEHDITQLVRARVDALTRGSIYCVFGHAIGEYHELNLTLQAAGNDTSELHNAIKETCISIVKLKAVRDKAVERFKKQGVLFKVVPVDKEEERLE
jgi:uncharacterized membrane protein